MTSADGVRLLEVGGTYDLVRSLRPLSDGGGDPTWRITRDHEESGRAIRALWTPDGAATVEVSHQRDQLAAQAWGPGSAWVLDRVDWMAGLRDDPAGFHPDQHRGLARVARRMGGLRMARSLTVWDVLVPIVLGQRVTTAEARRSWWQLVRRHGHTAPGAVPLGLAPTPHTVARLGDADWHVLGVERARADAVRGLLRVLPALERLAGEPAAVDPQRTGEFRRICETVRGVGPWTSTGLATAVLGDPDVVLLGDLHVPHIVCHALAGEERGSDERMLDLLEPFRGHRGRVVRLLKHSGAAAPKRGPRYNPLPIAEM